MNNYYQFINRQLQDLRATKREPDLSVEELEAQTNNEYAKVNCTLIANAFENKEINCRTT